MPTRLFLATLAGLWSVAAFGQCFVHVNEQQWGDDTLTPYLQLVDLKTNTLRIGTFEYTIGFDKEEPNLYTIKKKKQAIKNLLANNSGLNLWWLGRFARTRGADWENLPREEEHEWWADWVTKKAKDIDMIAVWNEPSLGWTPDKDPDRPKRHAALVVKVLQKLDPSQKVLAPSIHGVADLPKIGMGYTYAKQFFEALPEEYRSRVLPDAHMYYGYGDENLKEMKKDLGKWTDLLSGYGYQTSDYWFTEVGSFHKQPSSYSAGQTLTAICKNLISAGVPANHIGIWQSNDGVQKAFDSDGNLTDYGLAVQQLTQTP